MKIAYASSFKVVYLSSLAFAGVSIITAWFVSDVDSLLTNFVNKKIHGAKAGVVEKTVDLDGDVV